MRTQVVLALVLLSVPAAAQEAPEEPPSPRAPPYSLPWQLRSVMASTGVRSDSSYARYEDAASETGTTFATNLTASVRIPGTGRGPGTGLAPLLRLTWVADASPKGAHGTAIVNPLVGAVWAFDLGSGFRAGTFLGVTIPIGMGGGDSPDADALDARKQGPAARAMLDNALYAVNDLAVIPGIDVAWLSGPFTAQVEATLFELGRVRGAAAQPEKQKTNFTCGLHLGWFLASALSLGGELRYQRWLNAPIAVDNDPTHASIDTLTFAIGPRLHGQLGETTWVRPGIAFIRALDKPMASAAQNYDILQLDIPISF
jgi:hypothetical protein